MNSYILLRNNKESTSLNLDALRQLGLKPTDLIWVECQSVCWQHPHEIAELRSLVAVNNDQHSEQTTIQKTDNISTFEEEIPVIKEEKKRVFVELPASQKKPIITQRNEDVISSDIQKYGGVSNLTKLATEEKTDTINIKYSRPLDEIKEMYVKNLEKQSQSQKASIKIQLPKEFKKIAVYAGLVIAGAGLMLIVNAIGGKKTASIAQEKVQPGTVKSTAIALPTEPVENNIQEPITEENELPADEATIPVVEKETVIVPTKKSIAEKKENENKAAIDNNKEKIEKDSQPVKETIPVKPVSAESISSKLSLKANDYVVGSFGGIRNLEITLHNDSKYLLDKVAAELQYLNPEGMILKTENIYFQSVSPGEKETVAVKKSKRGVKINYKITSIESRVLNNGTAGL
jgi:hypothetical protein